MYISSEEENGAYDFGGVLGIYDHPAQDKETLIVHGPLKKPLALYVSNWVHEKFILTYVSNIEGEKNKLI